MWDPGIMTYVCRGRIESGISLGCFIAVHAFAWHSLTPAFPSLSPPQRVHLYGGERNNLCVSILPILVFLNWSEIL